MFTELCGPDRSVLDGERPARPEQCPEAVWQLMQQCWSQSAGDRPTFGALKMLVQDAYAAEAAAQAVEERNKHAACVVCLEHCADFALLPCGHKCVCEDHAAAMLAQGTCPLCRERVQSFNRIF